MFADWQLPSTMSRFFATGSDSESEESSSADEITPKATGTTFKQSVQLPLTCHQISSLHFSNWCQPSVLFLQGTTPQRWWRRHQESGTQCQRQKVGVLLSTAIFKSGVVFFFISLIMCSFDQKLQVWGIDQHHQNYPQCYEDSRHG